eukprot:218003_1
MSVRKTKSPKKNNKKNNKKNKTKSKNNQNQVKNDEIIQGTKRMNKKKSKSKKSGKQKKNDEFIIFGFSLPLFIIKNTTLLFITLSICHICASVCFAFLQEKVTHIEGFHHAKFMTVIETLTFAFCALCEISLSGGKQGSITSPRAPIVNYLLLSIFTFGGMFCTNSGLKYISYPTRIIFKGAKPVPTMIMEYLYVGKIFHFMEIISVIILVIGIIIFSSADASSKQSKGGIDPYWGYLFMCGGVIFDSFTSNFEKKNIFKLYKATHCEAMFFASIFGFLWSLITLYSTDPDMLYDGFNFFISTPYAILWLMLSSIGAYMSVVFVLLLIKIFSTTYAECVKGVRKVCSISASYLFLGKNKTFGYLHLCGVICFIISSMTTVYTKSIKSKKKKKIH